MKSQRGTPRLRAIRSRSFAARKPGSISLGLVPFAVVAALLAAPADVSAYTFVRGDVNGDGIVSISDLVHLAHHRLLDGPDPVCEDAADVDDDGDLALLDLYMLLEYLYGPQANALPEPNKTAGEDPTADSLGGCVLPANEVKQGGDIDHVYYLTHDGQGATGIAVYPGQTKARVPIFLDTNVPLSGIALSLRYDTAQVEAVKLDYKGSSGLSHGADRMAFLTKETAGGDHYVVAYTLMLLSYADDDELSIPAEDEQLVVTLELDVSPDLTVGDEIRLYFEDAPALGDEPVIKNEVVAPGPYPSYPDTIDVVLPVAAPGDVFLRGDVTRDSRLSILDVFALLEFLFGNDSYPIPCDDAADVNDDGGITLTDALQLLDFMYLSGDATPAKPFPYLGTDATPGDDFLGCVEN